MGEKMLVRESNGDRGIEKEGEQRRPRGHLERLCS